MSDFLFSSTPQTQGELSRSLSTIYLNDSVDSQEFHGPWGSLGVTASRYYGFQPLETDRHICVVIGGPVLYFQDNAFIGGDDPQAGTRAILEHWTTGKADWSEDLSGPFVILVIDKQTSQVECITDLMMFLPVYQYQDEGTVFWGTHIDALADACGQQGAFDEVSLVDFVLHHAVTYPYTAYTNIRQCQPASVHQLVKRSAENNTTELPLPTAYWQPVENNRFANLNQAAACLRNGVQGYIDRVTEPLSHVAQFISGGEDSRVLAGMLPERLERDGYIFLDSMNREGKVASKVAAAYGVHFKPDYRSETHYLDILPEASALVGAGHQYIHAHTLDFDKKHNLAGYRSVFGGYIADSLLKAPYARKPKLLKKLSFFPQIALQGEKRTTSIKHSLFSENILKEITHRRCEHYYRAHALRPRSAHEWFELWPATMRVAISNLYSNRRLFASYEVFMAKESVKVAASVPVSWKLNRRLFNRAFKPALSKTHSIFHANGRLPYYPWWVNSLIQFPIWFYQQVARHTGLQKKNQGAWSDWKKVIASHRWNEMAIRCADKNRLPELPNTLQVGALKKNALSAISKVNLLQICYQVVNVKRKGDSNRLF